MAEEAGASRAVTPMNPDRPAHSFSMTHLEKFVGLVTAYALANIDPSSFMSYQEGFEAGQFTEREACAKVCEGLEHKLRNTSLTPNGFSCANAIRARGAHQNS